MTTGVILALLALVGTAVYVIAPLLRSDALVPEESSGASVDELRDLHARQQMLLASLKDLEDDRSTDKVGDEDYESLKSRLSTQAIEIMQRIDRVEGERQEGLERDRVAALPLKYPGKNQPGGAS